MIWEAFIVTVLVSKASCGYGTWNNDYSYSYGQPNNQYPSYTGQNYQQLARQSVPNSEIGSDRQLQDTSNQSPAPATVSTPAPSVPTTQPSDFNPFPRRPEYNETHNPCTMEIKIPNYKKPGRRISEEKCLYYIWRLNATDRFLRKERDCEDYKRKYILQTPFFIGGRAAAYGELPHMGALGWLKADGQSYAFKCGASLISPLYMITAGHCARSGRDSTLKNQDPSIVRIGSNTLEKTENKTETYPIQRPIKKIIQHPKYKSPSQYFDIALVELASRIDFNERIQPACLWKQVQLRNTPEFPISSSGWGVTEVGGKTNSRELKVGDLDIINMTQCDNLLKPMCNHRWCGLQDHQVCAGKIAGGVDACQGDSGGPLQAKIALPTSIIFARMYYLLGVTSFGFGCARQNAPGVYTRISSFIDWIEPIVWPNDDSP